MTVDEAIKTLQEIMDDEDSEWEPDGQHALKLGIEALEVIKEFRTGKYKTINSPLPGETKDQ